MSLCSKSIQKPTSEGLEEIPISHLFSEQEDGKHDFEHEIYCWCYPTVFAYCDEDGSVAYINVEHKRIQ